MNRIYRFRIPLFVVAYKIPLYVYEKNMRFLYKTRCNNGTLYRYVNFVCSL